jgi:preprotein translocase subunit YajC
MLILEKLKKILFVTYNLKYWILIFLLGLTILFISIIIGFYTYLARLISFLSIKFISALRFNASTKGIIAFIVFVIAIIILFYSIYKIYKYFSKYNEKLIEKTFFETKLSKGPKIVTIGGGTGQYTSLYGLKNYTSNISAIVTTMDSGGSSQILKTEFGILPPGDLRNSILALSTLNEKQTNIFKLRFNKSSFKGHPIGNLVLTKLTEDLGLKEAIKEFSDLLRIRGEVFPVTYDKCELIAKLKNGSTIYGETNIDTKALDIKNIALSKKVKLI